MGCAQMSMKREPESEPLLSNGVGTNQQNRKIPPRFMDNQPPTDYDLGIKKRYPEPLSLQFRLTTVIGYVVGSIFFTFAPVFYFPCCMNYEAGGWMFVVGSAFYLAADFNEFWTNNRVGCILDYEYIDDFEEQFAKHYGPKNTLWGTYLRAERGLANFLNVTGSVLFLIGSILFIPGDTFNIFWGDVLYILASLFIMAGMAWKICRRGVDNPTDPSDRSWKYSKFVSDPLYQAQDSFDAVGSLFYLVGSIYFLPQYLISDEDLVAADWWWIFAGIFFLISAAIVTYRYFFATIR